MRIIIYILNLWGIFINFILPTRLTRIFSTIKNIAYTNRKKVTLNSYGKNIFFTKPIYLHESQHISIGNNFRSEKNVRLEVITPSKNIKGIIIGNNVHINWNCHIGAYKSIIIQDNVLIGSNVFITDHFHGDIKPATLAIPPYKRSIYYKGPVIIEKNVWIGENVIILPNVTIGENSIVGAGSVVTKSIPPNCVAVGNPAKIIKNFNSSYETTCNNNYLSSRDK